MTYQLLRSKAHQPAKTHGQRQTTPTIEPSSLLAAAQLNQPLAVTPTAVLQCQRIYGNRAAQRLIDQSVQRKQLKGDELDPSVSDAINQSRGSGTSLPIELRGSMEHAFQSDFSGVRIHTDQRSDQLNRSVQAKAFTIGSDIYFRKGNYDPSSSGGKELLAHELTHVVQQGGSHNRMQGKLTLGPVGDRYEQEADRMAQQITRASAASIRRAAVSSIGRHIQRMPLSDDQWNHIAHGEVRVGGKVVGFHWKGDEDNAVAEGDGSVTNGPNAMGVYAEGVQQKGKPKNKKKGGSTFFPDSWSESDVKDAIRGAAKSGGKYYEALRPPKAAGLKLLTNEDSVYPEFEPDKEEEEKGSKKKGKGKGKK